MVRNQMFDWVQRVAARRGYDAFGSADDIDLVRAAMAEYYDEHDEVLLDAGARSPGRFIYDRRAQTVTQILHDPDATNEWQLTREGRRRRLDRSRPRRADPHEHRPRDLNEAGRDR